eukprot:3179364-Amphidinium_carterae.2
MWGGTFAVSCALLHLWTQCGAFTASRGNVCGCNVQAVRFTVALRASFDAHSVGFTQPRQASTSIAQSSLRSVLKKRVLKRKWNSWQGQWKQKLKVEHINL